MARPHKDFSDQRDFSVPPPTTSFLKPGKFVFGPSILFFDADGHYVEPQHVKDELLDKKVRMLFRMVLTPASSKIYLNLDVLTVRALPPQVSASPSKKRNRELGI